MSVPKIPGQVPAKVKPSKQKVITAQNGIGTSDFVALAACLECLGGFLKVDQKFMSCLRPGDHITRTIMPDGSLELRLVHVQSQYVDPPELWPKRKPNERHLL